MGLFDILKLSIKCPTCHKNRERDWQIKIFEKKEIEPNIYQSGDKLNIDNKYIEGIGNCPICNTQHIIKIKIINNIITEDYKIFTVKKWYKMV